LLWVYLTQKGYKNDVKEASYKYWFYEASISRSCIDVDKVEDLILVKKILKCMNVFFGGPDKPRYFLRDLLAQKINAVQPGGEIFWITYYFRDFYLAEKLIEAANRGVKVSLVLEARPRVANANDDVYRLLRKSNNIDIRYVRHYTPHRSIFGGLPKIHEKVYYFKDNNKAFALIGSYNPSGMENDDPEIIKRLVTRIEGIIF